MEASSTRDPSGVHRKRRGVAGVPTTGDPLEKLPHAYVCVHIYIYVLNICIYICICICIYVHTYKYIHIYIYVCIYVYMYTYVCVYIYIYISIARLRALSGLLHKQLFSIISCRNTEVIMVRPWMLRKSYARNTDVMMVRPWMLSPEKAGALKLTIPINTSYMWRLLILIVGTPEKVSLGLGDPQLAKMHSELTLKGLHGHLARIGRKAVLSLGLCRQQHHHLTNIRKRMFVLGEVWGLP